MKSFYQFLFLLFIFSQPLVAEKLTFVGYQKQDLKLKVHSTYKRHVYYSLYKKGIYISSQIIKDEVTIYGYGSLHVDRDGKAGVRLLKSRKLLPVGVGEMIALPRSVALVEFRGKSHTLNYGQRFFNYKAYMKDDVMYFIDGKKRIKLDKNNPTAELNVEEREGYKLKDSLYVTDPEIKQSKESISDLVNKDKHRDDQRINALYRYLGKTLPINLEYFLLFSDVDISKTIRDDKKDIWEKLGSNYYIYRNSKLIPRPRSAEPITLSEEETASVKVDSRGVSVAGKYFRFKSLKSGGYKNLYIRLNSTHYYTLKFRLRGYYPIKRLVKYLNLSCNGPDIFSCYPAKGIVKQGLTNDDMREFPLVYSFDDEKEEITLNERKYKFTYDKYGHDYFFGKKYILGIYLDGNEIYKLAK
ncbi:MAG: hypothetical protein MK132_03230 [Lentisphaerales bacterium]|nr:hypothetical protein [Lentisphaerales bacterium]